MAVKHAQHGEVVGLNAFHTTESAALVKTEKFEAIRVVIEAGKSLPPHHVPGPITVQCLSGQCTFIVGKEPREMRPGDWLYLDGNVSHSVKATEKTALLVTILFPH